VKKSGLHVEVLVERGLVAGIGLSLVLARASAGALDRRGLMRRQLLVDPAGGGGVGLIAFLQGAESGLDEFGESAGVAGTTGLAIALPGDLLSLQGGLGDAGGDLGAKEAAHAKTPGRGITTIIIG
jgi:hypothetical protein